MSARLLTLSCAALILCSAAPAARAASYVLSGPAGEMSFEAALRVLMIEQENVSGLAGTDSDDLVNQSARLGLRGSHGPDLTWRLEWEMRGHEQGNDLIAKDLWFAWSPDPRLILRFGQMKVPFGRRFLVSTKRLATTVLPDAAKPFVPGRDIGAMAVAGGADRMWRLSLGVFQGAGDNASRDDRKHGRMLAARLECAPLGPTPAGEGDPGHSPAPRLLIGAAAVRSDDAPGLGADADIGVPLRAIDGEKLLYGADVSLFWRGVFAAAEWSRARLDWDADAAVAAGRRYHAAGLVLQAAWSIPGSKLQPRIMYDSFDPDDGAGGDARKTLTWGVNWLPRGHDFKIMAEYRDRLEMNDEVGDAWSEDEFRLLAQIWIH